MNGALVLYGVQKLIFESISIEATAGNDVIEVMLVVPHTALESHGAASNIRLIITRFS